MAEISLQDALNKFLKNSRLKSGMQSLQIEEVWEKVMGKTIAQYTDKIQLIGDKLIISTAVAPLKNELLFQKDIIITRINEEMGEVIVKEVMVN